MDGRHSRLPDVFLESPVELEAVAGAGDEPPLEDFGAAVVGVLHAEADAVADFEAVAGGEGEFLVVPVGVGGKLGCPRDGILVTMVSPGVPWRRTFERR